MAEENYNGWANWSTWNAYNWLTSEESVYNLVRNAIKESGVEWIRENAFLIVEMHDMTEDDRSKVDFVELYEAFAEDGVIG